MRRYRTTQEGSIGYVVNRWKVVAPISGALITSRGQPDGMKSV